MSVSSNNSGIHTGARKPTKKCVMKIKEEKNDVHVKIKLMDGRNLYGCYAKDRKEFEGPSRQLFLIQ